MAIPAIPAVGDQTATSWADIIAGWGQSWTAWTPALTAATTNPTLGTGGTTTGRYLQIGKTVIGWGKITFGTAATAAGSGAYFVNLPQTAASSSGFQKKLESSALLMKSAGIYTEGFLSWQTTTTCIVNYISAKVGGTLIGATNAAPGAWTINDEIQYQFTYETP